MIQKIKTYIATIIVSTFFFVPMALPVVVHAAPAPTSTITSQLCSGSQLDVTGTANCPSNSSSSLNNIIKFVLNIFSIVVGIIAVIMIVVGGLKYIISGGESGRVSGAKDTILFAVVGLVVVALAQVIVHFVLSSVANNTTSGG